MQTALNALSGHYKTFANRPVPENLNDLIETDNYDQINNLSCNTPFLVCDLDLEKEYANKEVWSTALYFKEIQYTSYEDFAINSIEYVNNELWGNLGVTVLIKNHKKKTNQTILNMYVEELKRHCFEGS